MLDIFRIYPNASVSQMSDWGGFNKTYCWWGFCVDNFI